MGAFVALWLNRRLEALAFGHAQQVERLHLCKHFKYPSSESSTSPIARGPCTLVLLYKLYRVCEPLTPGCPRCLSAPPNRHRVPLLNYTSPPETWLTDLSNSPKGVSNPLLGADLINALASIG
ncbi:unnamed protein product [Peniophora sp. CBMAI 1063]|nr:unnamed protein product [Peniophora sp. CBMAI 1063]